MEHLVDSDIIKKVHHNGADITLVGTAHVSAKSVELVETLIQTGDFDCIAVELCSTRHDHLTNRTWWRNLDIYQVIRQQKATLLLVNMALSAYQRRLAEQMGVEAGKEMQRAVELATEKGVRLEVIDRNVTTTLHRMTGSITWWQKFKLFSGLLAGFFVGEEITEEKIEELKRGDILHSVVAEFGEQLPEVKQVLIDERDEYMVGRLAQLVGGPNAPKRVIAFVGAGHLPGMEPRFQAPAAQDRLNTLDEKPDPAVWTHYVGWGFMFLVLILFYVGFRQSPQIGWQVFMTWVKLIGGMSALATALAFAHPLSILTAFVAAPITTLVPVLGVGMVVGLVESYLRKPKVQDFETLRDDILHWQRWWKNGVVRVLLAFVFSNLGAAVGMYFAGASIIHQLLG